MVNMKERTLWLTFTAILILVSSLLMYRILLHRAEIHRLKEHSQVLRAQADSLIFLLHQNGILPGSPSGLPDFERDELEQKGLQDPSRELLEDLLKHPELILFPSELGGTMVFSPDETFILTDQWLFTSFSDGHIKGYMLLTYQVDGNGKIDWEVIKSYLLE